MDKEKINLRELDEKDLAHVQQWKSDPELSRLISAPLANPSLEEVRSWFKKNSTDPLQKLFGIYSSDRQCIGLARLMFIDYKNSVTELGIYIGNERNRGKGFGKQSVNLLLEYAFVGLKLNRVFLKVGITNQAAILTYDKCGFQKEGVLRQHFRCEEQFEDVLVMGILKSEHISR